MFITETSVYNIPRHVTGTIWLPKGILVFGSFYVGLNQAKLPIFDFFLSTKLAVSCDSA